MLAPPVHAVAVYAQHNQYDEAEDNTHDGASQPGPYKEQHKGDEYRCKQSERSRYVPLTQGRHQNDLTGSAVIELLTSTEHQSVR